jgi:hypothetical protein
MVSQIPEKFFYLIQLAVGKHPVDIISIDEEEWEEIYETAVKQSLVGVVLEGVQKLIDRWTEHKPPVELLLEWIGQTEQIKAESKQMDERSAMLKRMFESKGYGNCILKGQGVARLYPKPEVRQPGDIDIWVDGKRDDVVKLLKDGFIGVSYIDYVNCHASYFTDAEVEVHFRPTWMYNPITNWKVQKWIQDNKDAQMKAYDNEVGFGYPTISFNLVFSLIHIYRHVFQEGIGLRQLTDYYYILTHSSAEERSEAYKTLQSFGLGKFVATIMFIMRRVFDIDKGLLLCEPNTAEGEFLLSEILRGGNFGHYDDRITSISIEDRWSNGVENLKRNFTYLIRYPSEVVWMPFWKMWHYSWRAFKGYL